jgi:mono/diheme cytochrome c family protein
MRVKVAVMAGMLFAAAQASAAEPTLTITSGGKTATYTTSQLSSRPDAAALTIPAGAPAYAEPHVFRAVPLLPLLGAVPSGSDDTLQARASDGFVAELPLALVGKAAEGGAVPWIALELPDQPWPPIPETGKKPGPFWLVWEHPERSAIGTEQWPYALASLTTVEDVAHRWPQLALPADLAKDAPAAHGLEVYIKQCLPCHKMAGGGEGTIGPDLGQPMNATAYMTDAGLRALIRDPKSVRTWPAQIMQGFASENLSDADLDDLIAYLHAKAEASPAQ